MAPEALTGRSISTIKVGVPSSARGKLHPRFLSDPTVELARVVGPRGTAQQIEPGKPSP